MKSIQLKRGKYPFSRSPVLEEIEDLEKKTSRTFHGYIKYFKWHICIKNREFWEVLERIRAHRFRSNQNSDTGVAFRELYSEKKHSDDSIQKLYRIKHS